MLREEGYKQVRDFYEPRLDNAEAKIIELGKKLDSEQQRTLRYKELLYDQDKRGKRVIELEKNLAETELQRDNLARDREWMCGEYEKKLAVAVEALKTLRQNLKWDAGNSVIIEEAISKINDNQTV